MGKSAVTLSTFRERSLPSSATPAPPRADLRLPEAPQSRPLPCVPCALAVRFAIVHACRWRRAVGWRATTTSERVLTARDSWPLLALALVALVCRRTPGPAGSHRPLPATAHRIPAPVSPVEQIATAGLTLSTVYRLDHPHRGRVACQFDPLRRGLVCATDHLSPNPHLRGTRVFRVDPATFAVTERPLGPGLHGSFLWGDFNEDGAPDVWAFADEGDDPHDRAVLYLGHRRDPWNFTPTRPLRVTHPVLGGAILDADGDGHEDLLLLGTGIEFQPGQPVSYARDAVYRGDGRGGFVHANRALGLDRIEDFDGHPGPARLGRTALVTDLNDDGCADLVVGNYRAHRNTFLQASCRGRFVAWRHDPDRDGSRSIFGHTVGLGAWDGSLEGGLDLYVFNLWHDDWRGGITDRSLVLRGGAREEFPQPLEAPFGAVVADFDGDRRPEVLLATGPRGQPYGGPAVLLRDGQRLWHDTTGWLTQRETPSVVDLNLDGAPDLVGDGRVLANCPAPGRRWMGVAFEGPSVSGSLVVLEDHAGGRAAFALAADGRGMPSNLLTVGLGAWAHPRRLTIYRGVDGRATTLDLTDAWMGRYTVITLPRARP